MNRAWQLFSANPIYRRVTLINFLFFMNFASFFCLPIWWDSIGFSELDIGLLMGAAGLSSLATIFLIASGIDGRDLRKQLFVGIIGLFISTIALVIAPLELEVLLIIRILHGISFAISFTATTAIVPSVIARGQLAQAIGYFGVFTLLTHALAPVIVETISDGSGFRIAYLISSLGSVFALILSYKLRLNHLVDHIPLPHDTLESGSKQRSILFLTSLVGASFGLLIAFLPVWAQQLGIGWLGAFFVGYAIVAISVRLIWGHLADGSDPSRSVAISALAIMMTILLISIFGRDALGSIGWPFLFVAGAGYGAGHGFYYPAANVQYVRLCPPHKQASGMSWFLMAFNLGVSVAMLGFGAIIEHYGYSNAFLIMAIILTTALVRYGMLFFNSETQSGSL